MTSYIIDAIHQGNLARFINDCCDVSGSVTFAISVPYYYNVYCCNTAQLLCQGDQLWYAEEDSDLLKERHSNGRGDHLATFLGD